MADRGKSLLAIQGYLTLGKAAKLLGLSSRWGGTQLRRILLRREKITQSTIMIRGNGKVAPKLFVTMNLLWNHCPELFSARDEIVSAIREHVAGTEERVDDVVYRTGVLARGLREVRERLSKVEKKQWAPSPAPKVVPKATSRV